jgi:hypothetical protein
MTYKKVRELVETHGCASRNYLKQIIRRTSVRLYLGVVTIQSFVDSRNDNLIYKVTLAENH